MRGNNMDGASMQLHDRHTLIGVGVCAQVEAGGGGGRGTHLPLKQVTNYTSEGSLSQDIYGLTFAVNISLKFMATSVTYWSGGRAPAAVPRGAAGS